MFVCASHLASYVHVSALMMNCRGSNVANDEHINGISIHFENSIGVMVDFCYMPSELLRFLISRSQNDQNIRLSLPNFMLFTSSRNISEN